MSQRSAYSMHAHADDLAPTAMVKIYDHDHRPTTSRCLIDTGSSANFITVALADRLKLRKNECEIPIGALNELSTMSTHWVNATIRSRIGGYQRTLRFLAVPRILSLSPNQQIDRRLVSVPANITLADPDFHKPAPIDVLIGAGPALSLLCIGQIRLSEKHQPDLFLQKTQLGWVIGGNVQHEEKLRRSHCHVIDIQNDISRFWEIEEVPHRQYFSKEEEACRDHFVKNVTRNEHGRYVVALPFNSRREELGHSHQMALKRFLSLERRFQREPATKEAYTSVIQEYIDLKQLSQVKDKSVTKFYLPHHPVIKDTSATTKLRVVFDGSAASSTGVSLNQTLMIGPTIQDDLFSLILRFRLHNIVLTGDIEKMYRQIEVRPEDRVYQRILWRNQRGDIETYELNTVTFGLSSAPYLAIASVHKLADDEENRYPDAARVLKKDLYVDDVLTGANSVKEAIQLRKDLTDILRRGGFNLRQWASNSPQVLHDLPEKDVNVRLLDNDDGAIKTLGVQWNSKRDMIFYTVKPIREPEKITKRNILSEIARIFDPQGLVNPVILLAKIIMQEIWQLKLEWDESVPLEIHSRWRHFVDQLSSLQTLAIPRKILHDRPRETQIHGFCDASERAYGACVYLRSTDYQGNINTGLYCAKSRVAPLKALQTIPRLELCAAVLLAELHASIVKAIPIKVDRTVFWSDSMITLHWIQKSPHTLKTFIANRVSAIQSNTDATAWRHVRTHENPADALSRGQLPDDLVSNPIWLTGPEWLSMNEENWPASPLEHFAETPESRAVNCCVTAPIDASILERYSSFTKLQRVLAYCLRFGDKNRSIGELTPSEVAAATTRLWKLVHQLHFPEELRLLKERKDLPPKSSLRTLNPFVDNDGLIRVGGRLINGAFDDDMKHPIVLPRSKVTGLLIRETHLKNLHAGVQGTLYILRQRYWPIDGRNQVRKTIRSCIRCSRVNPAPVNYLMGNLPRVRITEARPFTNVGIDYCGPFYIKEKRHRNKNRIKVYVAVFVCLSVKAVHMEVVSDMTTADFIAALRRFISRRGLCHSIYSDNGSNFVGARNELKDLHDLLISKNHNDQVQQYLTGKGIEWHFSPPLAPHFGGVWEAAVKSFKHHFKRVVGLELLTFDQFNTFVIEIEGVLNSRPITPLSSDPNDLTSLSPAHFLIGDAITSLPEQDFSTKPSNRLSTWQHISKLKQHFWIRWHKEYLNELTVRRKWTQGNHRLQVGSMVVLIDENLPPLQWRLGRIVEVHPGSDDVIRTVRVKTAHGLFVRSVKKLAPLPMDNHT